MYGLSIALLMLTAACSVEKTQSAKAPDVDVDVDPGRWPKYDVNWADIDVGTKTRTVTVPVVEVNQKQVEMEVPYLDINPPGATDVEERTVSVELEVPSSAYGVQIQEVRAAGDRLWVIAEIQETGKPDNKRAMRVSDHVVLRAPEDLNVRRVIVGKRPEGTYNQQYLFVDDRSALSKRLPENGGRVLYSRGKA
jgi:hypothetical protein